MPARRNIHLLVGGIGASLFGDGMFVVALGFAVFAVGGGSGALGVVLLAGVATIFACILPAGVIVDRLPRRHVLAACDIARCLLQLSAAAIIAWDGAQWWWLLPGSILFGAATALHQPATMSFVADVVPRDELEKVNGSLQAIRGIGIVVGGAIAGVIVAAWGSVPVMIVDAATFAVCAACIYAIRLPRDVEARAPARVAGGPTGVDDVRAAIEVVRSHRWLLHGLLLIAGFVVVSYGPIQVVGPEASRNAAVGTGVSPSVLWASISAATAIGMILGAVAAIVRPVAETMNALRVLLVLGGLGPVALALGVAPMLTLPGFAAIGAAMGLFSSGWESTKQSRIEPRMLARVASLDMLAQLTGMVTGVTAAAVLATFVSTDVVLLWIGIGCALLAITSAFSPSLTGVFRDRAAEVRDELGGAPDVAVEPA
jgi:MFS family permease